MSATQNEDAASSAPTGEFSSHVPRSEPLTTHGHQPGRAISEADKVPEFHAEVLPAGSAPKEHTFQPQIGDESDAQGQSKASDTLGGATSASVHAGHGKPLAGQTSAELHDGSHERAGFEGVGASLSKVKGEQEK